MSIVNSGSVSYSDLTLIDNLGEYTFGMGTRIPLTYVANSVYYFLDGVLQPAPVVTDASPLTITGIDVPAMGNTLVIYQVRVNEFAPVDTNGAITNTVSITGTDTTVNITASTTIFSEDSVLLSITKSISPSTVPENGRITYTFVIQNTGNTPAVATDNVMITDDFDPILENIAVTLNGTTLIEPTQYTYNEATGLFRTVAGVITVPAATYMQDPVTGIWVVNPGTATLTVTGTV